MTEQMAPETVIPDLHARITMSMAAYNTMVRQLAKVEAAMGQLDLDGKVIPYVPDPAVVCATLHNIMEEWRIEYANPIDVEGAEGDPDRPTPFTDVMPLQTYLEHYARCDVESCDCGTGWHQVQITPVPEELALSYIKNGIPEHLYLPEVARTAFGKSEGGKTELVRYSSARNVYRRRVYRLASAES